MKNPPSKLAEIGQKIGMYFLNQNNEDYKATEKFIRDLHISDIWETDDKIFIQTARPGLLIGRKAVYYDGLTEFLGKKIEIIESFCWADVITPFDWQTEALMEDEINAYSDFCDALEREDRYSPFDDPPEYHESFA